MNIIHYHEYWRGFTNHLKEKLQQMNFVDEETYKLAIRFNPNRDLSVMNEAVLEDYLNGFVEGYIQAYKQTNYYKDFKEIVFNSVIWHDLDIKRYERTFPQHSEENMLQYFLYWYLGIVFRSYFLPKKQKGGLKP